MQDCTDPVEKECQNGVCVSIQFRGKQRVGCGKEEFVLAAAFAGLDDNDKKCQTITKENGTASICLCNYDLCNKNLANPTSLASLTLLASLMLALSI